MAGGGGVCRFRNYYFLFYCFPKAYICEIYVKYTLKSKQIYPVMYVLSVMMMMMLVVMMGMCYNCSDV